MLKKFYQKHVWAKHADATRGPGFLVWMLLLVGLLVPILWLTRGWLWVPPSFGTPPPARPSSEQVRADVKLERISTAAVNLGTKPTQDAPKPAMQSDRGVSAAATGVKSAPATQDTQSAQAGSSSVSVVDALNEPAALPGKTTAENGAGDSHQPVGESTNWARGEGNNAYGGAAWSPSGASGASSGSAPIRRPDLKKLVWSAPDEASSPSAPNSSAGGATVGQTQPGHRSRLFLPRGELIEVYLLDTIETGNLASYVEFGVARNRYFNSHRPVLPFGAILIGASSQTGVRDRIQVSISAMRLRDGREFPIAGVVKDIDRRVGIKAYYIPQPKLVQLAPYVDDFLRSYLEILAQNRSSAQLQVGPVGLQMQPSVTGQAKDEALLAASTAVRDFAQKQLEELQSRYAAHLVAPRGLSVLVQLTSPFDAEPIYAKTDGSIEIGTVAMPARPSEGSSALPQLGVRDLLGGDVSRLQDTLIKQITPLMPKPPGTSSAPVNSSPQPSSPTPTPATDGDVPDFFPQNRKS